MMIYPLDSTYEELAIDDVLHTPAGAKVIECHKISSRVPNECFASWTAVCEWADTFMPFVVWTIIARPEGFVAESGTYCKTIEQAIEIYDKRVGR